MNLQHYRESAQQFGLPSAVYEVAYRAAHRAIGVMLWSAVVVTMDTVDKAFLADEQRKSGRFMSADELHRFASNPRYDLERDVVDRALARGDRCFGFTDGGVLMSYGWYSTRPTEVGHGLMLHFDPHYAYMYKGFTLPEYRGRRLHGVGMASALEAYVARGSKGLVSYIDSANFASLKSCERMGYHTFGHVLLVQTKRGCVTRATGACKAYGFRVEAQRQLD